MKKALKILVAAGALWAVTTTGATAAQPAASPGHAAHVTTVTPYATDTGWG